MRANEANAVGQARLHHLMRLEFFHVNLAEAGTSDEIVRGSCHLASVVVERPSPVQRRLREADDVELRRCSDVLHEEPLGARLEDTNDLMHTLVGVVDGAKYYGRHDRVDRSGALHVSQILGRRDVVRRNTNTRMLAGVAVQRRFVVLIRLHADHLVVVVVVVAAAVVVVVAVAVAVAVVVVVVVVVIFIHS